MLKGIDPLLSADLLWILAAMGHGDDLAIVDGNHPAETIARATTSGRLVRLPGVTMERAVAAILSVLPIDDFTADPVRRMQVVGKPDEIPPVQQAVQAVIARAAPARPAARRDRAPRLLRGGARRLRGGAVPRPAAVWVFSRSQRCDRGLINSAVRPVSAGHRLRQAWHDGDSSPQSATSVWPAGIF